MHFSIHKLWNSVITGSKNKIDIVLALLLTSLSSGLFDDWASFRKINRFCSRRPNTKERMCHQEDLLAALYKLACTVIVTRRPSKERNNYFFFGYHKDMIKVTFCINSYRKYTTVLVFRVYTAYQNRMIENCQKYCVSEVRVSTWQITEEYVMSEKHDNAYLPYTSSII
jgi:hypothetical protein